MDYETPHPDLYNLPWTVDEFRGMPYRPLGGSGLRVSQVGLGTWKIGYPETGDGARVDQKTALSIFDRAVEAGVTFWDTANRYNGSSGNAERIIGTWLKENPDQRRNVVLATKLFGSMDGRTPNHSRLSRSNILDSVYASLERMQIGHIDLLYFHAFDAHTPAEESLAAIEDLVQRDLVRYFGVSNFTTEQIELYRATAANTSIRSRIVAIQNQYDVLHGESDDYPGVLDYAGRQNISFIAWSPLARGLLTERYLDPNQAGPGDRLYDEDRLEALATDDALGKLRRLASLAHEWGWELNQLALAYMLSLPGMGPVIPSATTIQQLESNAAAGRIVLDDRQKLEVASILRP